MVYERTKGLDAGEEGPLVAEVALALYLCTPVQWKAAPRT
jgi:hypothetical protein